MTDPDHSDWDANQLLITEYTQLRAEIIKLTELQFQLVALTVIAFGTIASLGFDAKNAAIILIHPLVALTLGLTWLHHTFRLHRIAAYTRSHIEQKVGLDTMGWEHYVQQHRLPTGRPSYWALRAVFVVTAFLSVGVSLTVASYDVATITLLCLAVPAAIATAVAFHRWREPAPEAH